MIYTGGVERNVGCNILGYDSTHQSEKKVQFYKCCVRNRVFSPSSPFSLTETFLSKKKVESANLEFCIILYYTKNSFEQIFYIMSRGYFQNVSFQAKCLEHILEKSKNNALMTIIFIQDLLETTITYLIKLDFKRLKVGC